MTARVPAWGWAVAVGVQIGIASGGIRAEVLPLPGRVDSRIRTANYDADQVYELHGFVGYEIDLEFEPGETFIGLGAGDLEGVSYVGQENHLFLKPKAPQVATNLTVLTSRRHYHFDYWAQAMRPVRHDPAVIYSLRFTYPGTPGAAADAQARRVEASLADAAHGRAKNQDYWFCGRPEVAPVSAWDDGVHTHLRFAERVELPAVFARNDDDSESLLNFNMEAGVMVIHRVARRLVVRRGRLTGCIVNRGFQGQGARLESGTVSDEVERRVPGDQP